MTLRELEAESIREFVQAAADAGHFAGSVLDYGCGKQPYRDIVETAGGMYYGYDRASFPANVSGEDVGEWLPTYETILCTQVIQYAPDAEEAICHLSAGIKSGGHLVLTYPTTWPEVERDDLHRFTKAGMERLLTEAGFSIVRHEERLAVWITPEDGRARGHQEERCAVGYGVIARA